MFMYYLPHMNFWQGAQTFAISYNQEIQPLLPRVGTQLVFSGLFYDFSTDLKVVHPHRALKKIIII